MCSIICGTSVIIPHHFSKHLFVAASVALSGIDFGGFLSPIILESLLTKLSLSSVFLLLGCLMAMCSIFTIVLKPISKSDDDIKSDKIKESQAQCEKKENESSRRPVLIDRSVLTSPPIVIIYVASIILHVIGK